MAGGHGEQVRRSSMAGEYRGRARRAGTLGGYGRQARKAGRKQCTKNRLNCQSTKVIYAVDWIRPSDLNRRFRALHRCATLTSLINKDLNCDNILICFYCSPCKRWFENWPIVDEKIRIRLQTEVTEVPLWRQHTAKIFRLIALLEYTVCLSWGFPLYAIFDAA
jgi:hypothetical protein